MHTFKCRSTPHCSTLPSPNVILITPKDIGSQGFVIRKPGHYRLETKNGVLYWNPSRIASLITIDADNVILDLNFTTIIQREQSPYASTAITIIRSHQNITVHNGVLVGFTADTVVANGVNELFIENLLITDNNNRNAYTPSSSFASIHIQDCSNVVVRDISIGRSLINTPYDLLGFGILVLDSNTFLLDNCQVSEVQLEATTISQCIGIAAISSENGVMNNCNVAYCSSSGIMPGFGYILSQNILTEACFSNDNTGTQTTSGYYPQVSNLLQFINCEANSNLSRCQDCHGFPYFFSTNGFFSNCRALSNRAVNPSGGYNEKVTGFEIFVCVNCIVDNCIASNNITSNPIRHYAAGFANGTSSNVIFRNCISTNNFATGNISRGVGFGPALDPRFFAPSVGTIWENCIAEDNFGDALSVGFDLFGQVRAILYNSKSQNHGNLAIPNGVGILSYGDYDSGNPVDVPCDVVPIVVVTPNEENHVLVKDNIITNNSFARYPRHYRRTQCLY